MLAPSRLRWHEKQWQVGLDIPSYQKYPLFLSTTEEVRHADSADQWDLVRVFVYYWVRSHSTTTEEEVTRATEFVALSFETSSLCG